MTDQFDLHRFVEAQDPVIDSVMRELQAGRKESHWMWYVFPQIRGIGRSPVAVRFSLVSVDEARAYYQHEILGQRLVECTETVLAVPQKRVEQIFPYPDDQKFHSCMTLFLQVAGEPSPFRNALDRFYKGRLDRVTMALLKE